MGRLTPWRFLKDQFTTLPSVSDFQVDLTGKTVIVVGANVGLGLETACHFAKMKPGRLILACRTMEKAEGAVKTVQETTGCQTLEPWSVDLEDFKTVRAFADRYERDGGGHLDLLVMNAAVILSKFRKTADEWETTLQVNHLSTALLTLLLLPYLEKAPLSSPTPRIVIVSSEGHYFLSSLEAARSPQILEWLNDEQLAAKMPMVKRYWVSKLFGLFFVRSLASRLPMPSSGAPNVTVTSVNPGWCSTELNRQLKWTLEGCIVYTLSPILARSSEVGSRTLVWAALAGEDAGAEVHGRYTATCRVEEESDYALSADGVDVEERLWKETLSILEKVDPRVHAVVQEHLDRP